MAYLNVSASLDSLATALEAVSSLGIKRYSLNINRNLLSSTAIKDKYFIIHSGNRVVSSNGPGWSRNVMNISIYVTAVKNQNNQNLSYTNATKLANDITNAIIDIGNAGTVYPLDVRRTDGSYTVTEDANATAYIIEIPFVAVWNDTY